MAFTMGSEGAETHERVVAGIRIKAVRIKLCGRTSDFDLWWFCHDREYIAVDANDISFVCRGVLADQRQP